MIFGRNKKKKYAGRMKRFASLCIMLGMLLFLLAGCGSKSEQPAGQQAQQTQEQAVEGAAESAAPEQQAAEDIAESASPEQQVAEDIAESAAPEQQTIDENGSYTSKEDVALYLHTYGKLPSNFITKKEAKSLGWEGGSLEPYASGKCIGGDRFGNYEEVLPDGSYHECDIGTLGKSSRGAKRLVYSDDGRIYYTDDHYETFEQLY